jgi:hypothetical protein
MKGGGVEDPPMETKGVEAPYNAPNGGLFSWVTHLIGKSITHYSKKNS